MERWAASSDEKQLMALEAALMAFDYDTITDEGALKAVRAAKEIINR